MACRSEIWAIPDNRCDSPTFSLDRSSAVGESFAPICWGFVSLWIIKDIILFAFVWRAYEWKGSKDVHSLIGTQGVVIERLAPSGYIRVRGELWHAETMKEAVGIQENVRVQGNRGLTLLVQPCNEKHIQ